jgi:hypothetical protein
MYKANDYKRGPCRICRRWFTPNPRLKDRQKTCGDAKCKRQWHRKKCAEWNKKNTDYFRTNYLQNKLNAASPSETCSKILPVKSRFTSGLPILFVQEVIDIQHLIIIEYLAQLLFKRFQEVLRCQAVVNTGEIRQQLPAGISRCDRH